MSLSPEDRPAGGGAIFLTIKQNDRIGIATTIERLIDMLDAIDGDPDFGPYLANSWGDDREDENEHGGDICDEPHDDDGRELDDAELDEPGFIWGGNEAAEGLPC